MFSRRSKFNNSAQKPLFKGSLMEAAIEGNLAGVGELLERGADINKKENGETPLVGAVVLGHTETVRLLIDRGADLDMKSRVGETPLMLAILSDNTDIARLLIDKGANLDEKDSKGRSALFHAARLGKEEVTHLLIDNGAGLQDIQTIMRVTESWWGHQHATMQILKYAPTRQKQLADEKARMTAAVELEKGLHAARALKKDVYVPKVIRIERKK